MLSEPKRRKTTTKNEANTSRKLKSDLSKDRNKVRTRRASVMNCLTPRGHATGASLGGGMTTLLSSSPV
jgi:hypothetical protein